MFKKRLVAAAVAIAAVAVGSLVHATQSDSFDRFQKRVEKIAQEAPVKQESSAVPKATAPRVERIVDMGITSLRAIHGSDGHTIFMADNGRFVFTGQLFDIWQRKELKSIEEIAEAVRKIDLDKFGFNLEEIFHVSLGTGRQRVTVFVDPLCNWCHKLMNEVQKDTALLKDYTFDFVIVPLFGEVSNTVTKRLYCARVDAQEKFDLLLKGEKAIRQLPLKEECNLDVYKNTLLVAQMLGVKSAPFVIAPDGRFARGKPADLRDFLTGNSSDGGTLQ